MKMHNVYLLAFAAGAAVLWLCPGAVAFIQVTEDPRVFSIDPLAGDWRSLAPPCLTIALAFVLRRFVIALAIGVVAGTMVVQKTVNPLAGCWHAFADYMLPAFVAEFSIQIFLFIFFLIAMVQVMTSCGGIHGLVELLSRCVRGPRSARLAAFLLGLFIFFDDYTNTMVVGNAMRPLCDRWKVSREKLAYIVDSTAAPLAGLAVVSTWIAFEVGLIQQLSDDLGLGLGGYTIFFQLVPLRFYCISALLVVLTTIVLNRDAGPMLKAERRVLHGTCASVSRHDPFVENASRLIPKPGITYRWGNAAGPIAVVILTSVTGFVLAGYGFFVQPETAAPESWQSFFNAASPYTFRIFVGSAFAGLLASLALAASQRLMTLFELCKAVAASVTVMKYAVCILVLAWSMRDVCSSLGTAQYLASLVGGNVDPVLIPCLTFVLAAAIAFATGTSWGCMGILLPTVVPVAFQLGNSTVTFLCLAAVLDGAIFGDHCSPLSDTTIISSMTSGCSCQRHVITQLPYGMLAAACALGAYAVVGWKSFPPVLVYAVIVSCVVMVLMVVGRNPERNT
ncbi:MAG: Na+/H+ antiporter NhaC family protein [Deltaproteobacteria bacterium]|nr:Na+/H+ antiporter NhaC family protein [Deltaproteobacteria bacterium]